MTSSTALTGEQVEQFRRNGYFRPVTVMTEDEAGAYLERFNQYEAHNNGWYELSKGQKLYLLQTWVADMDDKALREYERVMALRQSVLYRDLKKQPAHTTLPDNIA